MAYDATDFVVTEAPITTERANMRRLRDLIANLPPSRFDMQHEGFNSDALKGECGSPACIGGWGRAMLRLDVDAINDVGPHLGLTEEQTGTLFYPGTRCMSDGRSGYSATNTQAVAVLDHYLATGKIDWSVA